jgi:hypothetical protein
LESAELRAKSRIDLTNNFWRVNVDRILEFQDKKVLTNAGSISKEQMENIVSNVYDKFDKRRKECEAELEEHNEIEELKQLEEEIKKNKE